MSKKFIGRFDNSMLEDIIEFDKRYRNTWLWVDNHLMECQSITDNSVVFYSEELGEIRLNSETEAELEIRWPEFGWFNHENSSLYCFRIPDRQWKRGICGRNFCVANPLHNFYGGSGQMILGEENLRSAFKKETSGTIISAVNSFKRTNISARALSEMFSVSLPPKKKDVGYLLWYGATPVAEINVKQKEIIVKYPYVKQEIKDYNRDFEENLWKIR